LEELARHVLGIQIQNSFFIVDITEHKSLVWLIKQYPFVEHQKISEWTKTEKSYKRYDFPQYNLLIELYGAQHFRQVSNRTSFEECRINDESKNKMALRNGMKSIRIDQESVLQNREDWDSQLRMTIVSMINTITPKISFMWAIYADPPSSAHPLLSLAYTYISCPTTCE